MIDLRSDTLTLPTQAMRQAMAEAAMGDDGYGEDPTVNQLEAMAAEIMGKEAALFFTSGTQANLAALLAYCQRGHEAIVGDLSHIFLLEAGGSSALGGVHICALPNQKDGTIRIEDIKDAIRPDDKHFARTRLICLENTHMICGGTILTPEYTDQVGELARKNNLPVHLDGARIFNAAVRLKVDVKKFVQGVDSVMFSLAKGLGAPMGALLCGSQSFIQDAVRVRQMLGGGMHQAGVLAAAGIEGLKDYHSQLGCDNDNARRFAKAIFEIPDFELDLETVQTNIVLWKLGTDRYDPPELVELLEEKGVRIMHLGGRLLRAVVYRGINPADIDRAIQAIFDTMKK